MVSEQSAEIPLFVNRLKKGKITEVSETKLWHDVLLLQRVSVGQSFVSEQSGPRGARVLDQAKVTQPIAHRLIGNIEEASFHNDFISDRPQPWIE